MFLLQEKILMVRYLVSQYSVQSIKILTVSVNKTHTTLFFKLKKVTFPHKKINPPYKTRFLSSPPFFSEPYKYVFLLSNLKKERENPKKTNYVIGATIRIGREIQCLLYAGF